MTTAQFDEEFADWLPGLSLEDKVALSWSELLAQLLVERAQSWMRLADHNDFSRTDCSEL